jgi:L-rhamnose-H+ transport protein
MGYQIFRFVKQRCSRRCFCVVIVGLAQIENAELFEIPHFSIVDLPKYAIGYSEEFATRTYSGNEVIIQGITLAIFSGICNGLFTAPMKLMPRWNWENIWIVFIVVSCLIMPVSVVSTSAHNWTSVLAAAPAGARLAALGFGFLWGFGAICFGLSVDRLGVAVANSLVIGISSALGSVVPLLLAPSLRFGTREAVLGISIAAFLVGVWLCGAAGRLRDAASTNTVTTALPIGYVFAAAAGIMSAVFNIGYAMALPIADAGVKVGLSRFTATNVIWLLMLGAGALPNLGYCAFLLRRNGTANRFKQSSGKSFALSIAMGVLWGGSIFLYGAATPLLGDIGPSVGWPLSLAVGLLVANLMGLLLREWRNAGKAAKRRMIGGIAWLIAAIVLCAFSTRF